MYKQLCKLINGHASFGLSLTRYGLSGRRIQTKLISSAALLLTKFQAQPNLYLQNFPIPLVVKTIAGCIGGTLLAKMAFDSYPCATAAPLSEKEVIQEADHLYDNVQYEELFNVLTPFKDCKNSDILWRLARAMYEKARVANKNDDKKKFYGDALQLLLEAESIDGNNFAVQKWLAIIMDSYYTLDGIKSRISHLYEMKTHMEKACELNPKDGTSWHVLGMWYYGIADISWYERKIASVFFATPPAASYEDALKTFLHAEEIEPNFYSKNYLMIGKCFSALGKKEEAKEFWNKAKTYPPKTSDDEETRLEAEKLLKVS